MTVVVTGGAGFLGRHLVAELAARGREVTVLAHGDPGPARRRLAGLVTAGPPPRVLGVDVTQPDLGLPAGDYRRLAARTEEIWHAAASVVLDGRRDHVWRTNVAGTAHVLRFAAATEPRVPLRHVSTAFVAGRYSAPVVREADARRVRDFENWYERSKRTAEVMVERHASRGRAALLLRPSILVPGAVNDELDRHTLGVVARILRGLADREPGGRLPLRVGADPRSRLNLAPVDWAARAMLAAAAAYDAAQPVGSTAAATAVHVTHPYDVPVRVIAAAMEDTIPVRLRTMPAPPADPTRAELALRRLAAGFLPYLYHRRHFDPTRLMSLVPRLPEPPVITREYLADRLAVPATAVRGAA